MPIDVGALLRRRGGARLPRSGRARGGATVVQAHSPQSQFGRSTVRTLHRFVSRVNFDSTGSAISAAPVERSSLFHSRFPGFLVADTPDSRRAWIVRINLGARAAPLRKLTFDCSGNLETERDRCHGTVTRSTVLLPQDVFSRKIRSVERDFKLRPAGAAPVLKGDMPEAATAID